MSDREDQLVGDFPFIPKQERAQQKRNALLESGHALFISKGYEQTTAKEIAANAGVATGTFYRYFLDKRQLLMSLLEDKIEKLLPPEPSWENGNPEARLAELLESYGIRLNHLGLHRVLPELLLKDPGLSEVIAAAKVKIHNRIYTGLQKASELGLTWKDLDLNTLTWSIMLLAENATAKVEHSGNPAEYREIAKIICRLVFPPDILKRLQTNDKNETI
ncbi:TetR/AcrR family transcriptional regulator [Neobacillus niacini]|uniref:TetR/AcrR family transcriptional regulator n=1 Tax=Neobacillus niacini TaxID=86668 RepID=UPI0028597156|nr:TetR/AcrR family transcriptional regulator [Neobacillus niacini]MDR7000942.1 AcrR family transcriptional regulator [Neobacillus niacini]